MGKPRYYTPAEAGKVLGLRPGTVRFLCDTRRLRAIRTATGRRLIAASDLERLRRAREQGAKHSSHAQAGRPGQ